MLLDWGRLEDAGYVVGARVLELLFYQEKVWNSCVLDTDRDRPTRTTAHHE